MGFRLSRFGVRRLQFLGEGTPDTVFAADFLLCGCLDEGTDAGALVEVGVVRVLAGTNKVNDLMAGIELGIAGVVETSHEVKGLRSVCQASANGGEQLLEGLERECMDFHFPVVFDVFKLLADIGHGRSQNDADECEMRRRKFGDDMYGRIAFDEELEECLFTAGDTVKKLPIVTKSCGDLLVGLHDALFHAFKWFSRSNDVRGEFALGNGDEELTAGLIEAD